jgi:hypothetical protein
MERQMSEQEKLIRQMEMDTKDPLEIERRVKMALEALRNGHEVRGAINGQIVVLNGGK